ncbi:hypothetical protein B566_EDAN009329 [Ephemera danica]|nr:hypothetical protein B566_EDAN009329 [Ephemera danica]
MSTSTGRAVAELRAPDGHALGEVEVRETRSGTLQLTGALTGLTPGAHLGLSVHESGDCRQLGPIFRPDQPADAPPSPAIPAGFLGSTLVSKDGHVTLNLKLGPQLALAGRRSMLARGVALYELEEPGRSPQSREALACGVLGRALPSPAEVAAARRRRHFQHVAVQLLPHTFISQN